MEVAEILNKIISEKGAKFGDALSDRQIKALEIELGMKFADSYKLILKKCGFISYGGFTLFGASEDSYYDIISRNKKMREEELPDDFIPLPDDAYAIVDYGGGYYLQYAKGSPREGQISLVLDETFYNEEDTWPDLEAFLKCYFL